MIGACLASGLIPSSILCTPVLNSYSAQPNFGAPASPAGSNPARPGGFPGANSPGPVADLYGPASQDSGVGNYISAASPQPGSGFGHGIAGPLIATAFTNGYHWAGASIAVSLWEHTWMSRQDWAKFLSGPLFRWRPQTWTPTSLTPHPNQRWHTWIEGWHISSHPSATCCNIRQQLLNVYIIHDFGLVLFVFLGGPPLPLPFSF